MDEAKSNLDMVNVLLNNEKLFNQVVKTVFDSIDTDKSGSLELSEMEGFMRKVCDEMNIKGGPNKSEINEIFESLDTDKSKSIGIDEMGAFLKKILLDQQKSLTESLLKK
eukprot:TRINITY_DN428_c0_g1_i3.p2 TRINITY_DN428_c0_g1~~TRINITY_DN428_c0_g1_i3.p2  ORF type:complete len:110 (-),score=33.17 TRINITY_DN428_c0_g1_i3:81-410(-)